MAGVAQRRTRQRAQQRVEPHLTINTPDFVTALAYFPDGRKLVTSTGDGAVTIWNTDNGKKEAILVLNDLDRLDAIVHLAVTQDGKTLICGALRGKIKILDVGLNEIVKEWTHPGSCQHFAISLDDRLLAVGDSEVYIHGIEGWDVKQVIQVHDLRCLSFPPAGDKLACATGRKGDIRVYDVTTGTLLQDPFTGHKAAIYKLLWSRDGHRLFSVSYDRTIRSWNADTGEQIGHPWTGLNTGYVEALSLSPDGLILASVSSVRITTIRFWNAATGALVGKPLRCESVASARFSPSGELAAFTTTEWKLFFWQVPQFDTIDSSLVNAYQMY